MAIEGKDYHIGMEIYCNETSVYAGLYGHILELRDGEDKESENETVEVVCALYVPGSDEKQKDIESRFSELYGRFMSIDDIGLDYVIMAPEMVSPLDNTNPLSVMSEIEKITQAVAKLEREANSSGGQNVPSIPIYNHLRKICESDTSFAGLVNQEHKTLIKCFSYIYEQVRNTIANGANSIWVADGDVYKLSEDYYRLDDAEIERRKSEEKKKRDEELAKKKIECGKQAAKKTVQQVNNIPADGQIMLGMDDSPVGEKGITSDDQFTFDDITENEDNTDNEIESETEANVA